MKYLVTLLLSAVLLPASAYAGLVTIRETADHIYVEYTGDGTGKSADAAREVVRSFPEPIPGEIVRSYEVTSQPSLAPAAPPKVDVADSPAAKKEEARLEQIMAEARRQEAEAANLPDQARRQANEARAEARMKELESRPRHVRSKPRRISGQVNEE